MEPHVSKADKQNPPVVGSKGDEERKNRLAAQLRANLARRKAQARSRRQGEADKRPEGLQSSPAESEE